MDASEFLTLSGRLVGMGKAGARSATSRACYSAFHQAQEFLRPLTGEAGGRSHSLVPEYLEGAGHPTAREAARLLSDLHSDRLKADYKLSDERAENIEFAKDNVEVATTIATLLRSFKAACASDPLILQALVDGIAKVKAAHRGA